jgi:hypothetical protein
MAGVETQAFLPYCYIKSFAVFAASDTYNKEGGRVDSAKRTERARLSGRIMEVWEHGTRSLVTFYWIFCTKEEAIGEIIETMTWHAQGLSLFQCRLVVP